MPGFGWGDWFAHCALARRLSTKMRFQCAQVCSCLTPVYPNAFPMCPDAVSHDTGRSKCISHVLRCALARRPSAQMRLHVLRCALARHPPIQSRFICVQMRSRLTLVDPNALPVWLDALSLDACRFKYVTYVLRCVLARRPSIHLRSLCAQMRSCSTPVNQNCVLGADEYLLVLVKVYVWQSQPKSSQSGPVPAG